MTSPNVNPLSGDHIINNTRIDQGVDFQGTGPIHALNDAEVVYVNTGTSGWPGLGTQNAGPYIAYKLTAGPDIGKYVYVAEDIHPLVKVGDTVKAGQQIANQVFTGTGIETGWADPSEPGRPLSQTSAAGGITGADLPVGGTKVGRSFEAVLTSLGVGKANNYSDTSGEGGSLPSGYSLTGSGGDSTAPASSSTPSGGGGGLLSFPPQITTFFDDAGNLVHALTWLTKPSNWVRIIAFFGALVILLFAIHALMAAGTGAPIIKAPSIIPVPV
jgi:hypothetical protein